MKQYRLQLAKLSTAILHQEIRRKKLFLFLMTMALLITGLLLFSGNGPASNVQMSFEYEGEAPDWMKSTALNQMMALSGIGFQILPAFLFGLILAVILPWRGRDEWEQGTFPMWMLSPWPPLIWESLRILSYGLTLLVYYALLLAMAVLALNQRLVDDQSLGMVSPFVLLFVLVLLTMTPFLLGLSALLAALKAAYRNQSRNWTISVMLGVSWWVVVSEGFRLIFKVSNDPKTYFLPPWKIALTDGRPLISDQFLYWYPEWLLASWILAIAMIFLAGRIYDEIEVI